MAEQTWLLTDVANRASLDELEVSAQQAGAPQLHWSFHHRRLAGGRSDRVELLTINNGTLQVDVLPTRGMGIWQARVGDTAFGWNSPIRGPVHPAFVPVDDPGGLGWLRGFDELLVRCGLVSNGAPEFDEDGRLAYPLHGRVGNLPAEWLEVGWNDETQELRVTGTVLETCFHFAKLQLVSTLRTRAGSRTISIEDHVTNLSASPAEAQMLYHVNFGAPLLDAGAQLVVPASRVVPRNNHAAAGVTQWADYAAPTPGFEEQVYFMELQAGADDGTAALLRNAHGTLAAGLRYRTSQLPCFTVWKNTTAEEDGYVTGLEPGTNFPNPRSFEGEHGRVLRLAPGETVPLQLDLDFHVGAERVAEAVSVVQSLSDRPPDVADAPDPAWCDI